MLPPPRESRPQLSFFFFAKKFSETPPAEGPRSTIAAAGPSRMRWNGQIFWLLASEEVESLWLRVESRLFANRRLSTPNHQLSTRSSFLPPSPPNTFGDWPWEIVSSYSSATAPESHGNSSHRSTTATNKELPPEVAACACPLKIYLSEARIPEIGRASCRERVSRCV